MFLKSFIDYFVYQWVRYNNFVSHMAITCASSCISCVMVGVQNGGKKKLERTNVNVIVEYCVDVV